MPSDNIIVTKERDPIYDTLLTQSITLSEIYEQDKNYISLAWILLSANKHDLFTKKVETLENGMKRLAGEYLKDRTINTSLFVALAAYLYVCSIYNKKVSIQLKEAMSAILVELTKNKRLRTTEMVGTILFFLSTDNEFNEETKELKDYVTKDLPAAVQSGNCAQIIDSYFGLIPADVDSHIFEECLKNRKLLSIERLAKALIILSLTKSELKERYFSSLRDELKDKYIIKLNNLVQAVINGLSLVESNLPEENIKTAFEALKNNDWTKVVEINGDKVEVKKISPDFITTLDSKTIGLCVLAFEKADKTLKISLYPEEYAKLKGAWNEKKFGFGLNKKHLQYFHLFSLVLIVGLLLYVAITSELNAVFIEGVNCVITNGVTVSCLSSATPYSIIVLLVIGLVIAYHRAFNLMIEKGEFGSVWEVICLFPLIGEIIKNIEGKK